MKKSFFGLIVLFIFLTTYTPKFDFIIGKKLGMTRIFDHMGNDLPVTIVEAGPCPIVQVKLEDYQVDR